MEGKYQTMQVITCENCKHWRPEADSGSRETGTYACVCAHWSWEEQYYTKPADFCSGAELNDGEEL